MEIVLLIVFSIIVLVYGISMITTYTTSIKHSLSGVLCVFAVGALIMTIVIHSTVQKEQSKTMTINYEFRDSVYIPIDTVINNK